ncbi:MAG: hypothetical protein M1818_007591 [Claussenomyces sp. TS43310]|nr:MAG: hypothetical protein M1818_007591 [Claussenomyces sp. TS43310]
MTTPETTSGYVFKNSGTSPPAMEEPSEGEWDHHPTPSSSHQSATSHPGPTHMEKANAIVEEAANVLIKSFAADSHDLALEDHEIKGAVQTHPMRKSSNDVRDLGWHKTPVEIPDPLIGGLSNGRLWSLIRRFNKDVFDVRAVPEGTMSGLDLTEAWNDEHGSDKMTLHLQRAYLTIVLGLASFGKQMSRLRSWKETRRTTIFCLTYLTAWLCDLLVPLVLGTLMVITASESTRNILFPPAPRALVNISTGGLQKPQAGQLGTSDTLTGAPEKQQGEAAEEEAANFVDNVRHLVMRAVGMHQNENEEEGDPLEGKVPKPLRKAIKSVKAAGSAPGHATADSGNDQTQQPMEEVLWTKAKPKFIWPVIKSAPHAIGEIVENWERCANTISPTSPFSQFSFLRIEGVLMPLFLTSFFLTQYMVYKASGFAIGFIIFGDPILSRALAWLNQHFPDWLQMLQPKNNILRGVPTNNQLTLTLLRIGEIHHSPIPPVPRTQGSDENQRPSIDVDKVPLAASRSEVVEAIEELSPMEKGHGDDGEMEDSKPKHRHLSKIVSFLKGNTKTIVESKMAVDHVRAAAGSHKAQGHLGVVAKLENIVYAGPNDFKARLEGKKGWLYITSTASDPTLSFTTDDPRKMHTQLQNMVTIPVRNIQRVKRATAFASKPAEMAANWSADRELLASVEIVDEKDKTWRFTAVPERDELFNRLVALGKQKWENM